MASKNRRWSSELVSADYKEIQATAMGLSVFDSGQFALLGGRKSLALINLSDPKTIVNKVSRNLGKWEISSVQWAPVVADRIAIAANDRIEIVNPENDLLHEQILMSHTRYISDIDWNPKEPHLLASGAHDASLNLWDLRSIGGSTRKRPALTFNMIVSASQVKWNKINTSIIATSHEGDLKLWDTRKASTPFQYLTSHISRVYSVDWSPHSKDHLVTSAQDCFVKFFNITSSAKGAMSSLKTALPVWKAKYTPFGDGLATVIVPQLQRNDHSLFLWNHKHLDFPVHSFFGHKDVILEYGWRNTEELQMVTFSKDHTLRLWAIEPFTQYQCGVDPSEDLSGSMSSDDEVVQEEVALESTQITEEQPGASIDSTPSKTLTNKTLQQEFELLNLNLGSVKAEGLTSGKRCVKFTATVAANQAIHRVCLVVHFPLDYPSESSPPSFVFAKGTTLDPQARTNILKALRQTAEANVKEKSPCLEPCLRQLESLLAELPQHLTEIDALAKEETAKPSPPPFPLAGATLPSTSYTLGPVHFASYDNAHIPYPRTSGACFSRDGRTLVCFGRSSPRSRKTSDRTPRSLAYFDLDSSSSSEPQHVRKQNSLGLPSNPYASVGESNSNSLTRKGRFNVSTDSSNSLTRKGRFRVKRVRSASIDEGRPDSKEQSPSMVSVGNAYTYKATTNPKVTIYDVTKLFPWEISLAVKYTLWTNNPEEACLDNYKRCCEVQRFDLAKFWQICAKIASLKSPTQEFAIPWTHHPMGKKLLTSIIDYCIKDGDFQTSSAILCCFWSTYQKNSIKKVRTTSVKNSPLHQPYLTVHGPLEQEKKPEKAKNKFWFMKPGALPSLNVSSPYHTIQLASQQSLGVKKSKDKGDISPRLPYTASENNLELYMALQRGQRSNSCGDTCEEALYSPANTVAECKNVPQIHVKNVWPAEPVISPEMNEEDTLLDMTLNGMYDKLKAFYAEQLYIWQLPIQRICILKASTLRLQDKDHNNLKITLDCPNEEQNVIDAADSDANIGGCGTCGNTTAQCLGCLRPSMECCVCLLPVRGLASCCQRCGHGGHYNHVRRWFTQDRFCPVASCNCECLAS